MKRSKRGDHAEIALKYLTRQMAESASFRKHFFAMPPHQNFAIMAKSEPPWIWSWENDIETRLIASDTCYQVLVVDDMREVRLFLTLLLQRWGHTVKSVDSAKQALTALNEYPADVIISDISMPEIDGYEFVRTLRRRPDTRSRYIVAMTGNGEISSAQASLAAGFDAHLAKPFHIDQLRLLLAETNILSNRNAFA